MQPIPLLILAVGGVLLLAGALLFLSERPAPAADTSDTIASIPDNHDESGLPYPEVARISLEQTKANFEQGTAVIIDVRSSEEYNEAHIPGAISMPLKDIGTRSQELSKGDEIITYCA
jgi:3-mercaptopyruvate sulfurtransferase SseA